MAVLAFVVLADVPVSADKPLFTATFTPAEFSARRAKVMAAIGDAVAIVSGATETPTYTKFRQGAEFFYLCGVEVPRAILLIDGRSKTSTLFLGPGGPSNEGPLLAPDDEARRLTGIEQVLDRGAVAGALAAVAAEGRIIYMPDREETLGAGTTDRVQAHLRATQQDPWDQSKNKELVFKDKVQAAAPNSSIKNLDPIVDALRVIKSPAEVAVIRESTRIASLGILDAMKSARPGLYEYEFEDPVVITATGFEHLSAGLPMEIADVEPVMREPGLADAWKPPAPGTPLAAGRGGGR